MNHLHIADLHQYGCEDASPEKFRRLGHILKEIYETKLQRDFPDRPCQVSFDLPDDKDQLMEYEITFWQTKHRSSVE